MLTRTGLLGLAHQGLRAFTSSAITTKSFPTLGDSVHTPENVAAFKSRVEAYRDKLASERKAAVAAGTEDPSKRGILRSLMHGSATGQLEEAEMERSYSQLLARGKYVHAIEFHTVKPDQNDAYVDLVGKTYPAIAGDPGNQCHLVGSWKTEVGDVDTFVHIWEYQGYAGYHLTLNRIQSSAHFQHLSTTLPSMLSYRRTDLMQEFSFWPTTAPRKFGGIFELRSYMLNPGNLLQWETHWRKGLAARRKVMEGVGAWFTQVGDLNRVHYLWQFADLRARQLGREMSWKEPGWSTTVHKTVPLIKKMESRIMVPMPWSPVA